LYLTIPLIFFHDAITGTHQDTAYEELTSRLGELARATAAEGLRVIKEAGRDVGEATVDSGAAGRTLLTFNPATGADAVRVPLEVSDWRDAPCLAARDGEGRRYPVVQDWHRWSPPLPAAAPRTTAAVGPSATTRPCGGRAGIEATDLPPLAWSQPRLETCADPQAVEDRVITNPHLEIRLGAHGVDRITDRASGAEVRGETIGIGGLVLEEDEGDPWGTRKKPVFRNELAEFTRYLGALRFTGYQEAYYGGRYEPCVHFGREEDPNVFALSWYVTVRLLDGARRVDFGFEVFWQSINRRIRAVFPVQSPSDAAWYSIPGGWLERPRYEQTETHLWSPNGDWPALHFVAARPGKAGGAGWAVVNHGTPSARVEDGRILVSLLRSPGFSHCLERYAQDYPMPTSTMDDGGWHHFRLSLLPHGGLADMPRLAAAASALNQSPPVMVDRSSDGAPSAWWRLEADGIEVLSVKRPFRIEADREAVIRLLNLGSEPNRAILHFASATVSEVALCRLTEDEPVAVPVRDCACEVRFHPFEVITLRVKEVSV
jgi:alpha-mannosidase